MPQLVPYRIALIAVFDSILVFNFTLKAMVSEQPPLLVLQAIELDLASSMVF